MPVRRFLAATFSLLVVALLADGRVVAYRID